MMHCNTNIREYCVTRNYYVLLYILNKIFRTWTSQWHNRPIANYNKSGRAFRSVITLDFTISGIWPRFTWTKYRTINRTKSTWTWSTWTCPTSTTSATATTTIATILCNSTKGDFLVYKLGN